MSLLQLRVKPALPENISQKTGMVALRITHMIWTHESRHIGRSSWRRAAPLLTVSFTCSRLGVNRGPGAKPSMTIDVIFLKVLKDAFATESIVLVVIIFLGIMEERFEIPNELMTMAELVTWAITDQLLAL